ncbi:hypothetical protein BTO20_37510 (plasmid) [Mycobacterium dioxanotrophicus]|jgi:hypothetical protein|uniref:DNA helicase DnaB-like N-terminal domain-containing protein n=1 Tax=Mycobacterium dioxanotrophicus TaxID=482462 RepID=A0A1Y0CGA8_9MYCO|nr:hypothetical protein [Mycobacterium dioxanotrophicus]ART74323.1 hypothetical protein BTO20_37510 [Mycobacterium dioxanotrophicus]
MTTPTANTLAPEEFPFMWEPEDQLIGALLHLRSSAAADIIALVPAAAVQHPVARWAYELITTLVQAGDDPDPTVVLTAARRQPPACDNNAPAELTTTALRPNVYGDLGTYLANAYTNTHNIAQVRDYARTVLDDHFRRTAGAWGARLQALADAYADREEITAAITELMRGELRDLWLRAERATKPEPVEQEATTVTTIPAVWQYPLTAEQYKALIDCKYQATTQGWALLDNHGRVRAWHWQVPGDAHWATAQTALRAFLPDTKHRGWRTRTGWTIQADDGELLNSFLSQAKPLDPGGDNDHVRD